MSRTAVFRSRFLVIKLLRGSLFAGVLLDVGCAVSVLRSVSPPAAAVTTAPKDPFYLWAVAGLFTLLAVVGLMAARDIRRYSAFIPVVTATRVGAGVLLISAARAAAGPSGAGWLAFALLFLGLTHVCLWWPLRPDR